MGIDRRGGSSVVAGPHPSDFGTAQLGIDDGLFDALVDRDGRRGSHDASLDVWISEGVRRKVTRVRRADSRKERAKCVDEQVMATDCMGGGDRRDWVCFVGFVESRAGAGLR